MADVYRLTGAAVVASNEASVWRYSGIAVVAQYGLHVTEAQIAVVQVPTVRGLSVYDARIDVIEAPGTVAPPAPDQRMPIQILSY